MRIAVYPHDLGIGGSQLNAIELAAGVRDLGHEALVVGRRGALVERVRELGLEFVELPAPSRRPSRRVADALRRLVRDRGLDVLHGYEWPPTLEAVWAAHGSRAAVVSTVMSMAVPPFIPHSVPLLVGTEEIAAGERERGRSRVGLLEPPVDLRSNGPGFEREAGEFRHRLGISSGDLAVVVVTRLAHQLKLEGLLAAMSAIGRMRTVQRVRLVVVGDGPARREVEAAAEQANERHGEGTVVLAGELGDPRPAYAAADITLGMGGSALRAMAFGKPLVVQGEEGFWRTLTPDSVDQFLWTGWYGRGAGRLSGEAALAAELDGLVHDPDRRAQLGEFGRALVAERFSLDGAARRQLACYQRALEEPASVLAGVRHELVGGLRYVDYYARKRVRRARGISERDDFNSRPVSTGQPHRRPLPVAAP